MVDDHSHDNVISAAQLAERRSRANTLRRMQMQPQQRTADMDRRRTEIQHHCPHVVEAPLVRFNRDSLAALIDVFKAIRQSSSDPSYFEMDDRVIRFFFKNEADAVQILKDLR